MTRMKKYKFLMLILLCFICSGCTNQYFTLNSEKELFYGAFLTRDFSHGDIQMQTADGKVKCAGVLFINEFEKTKDDNNKKYSDAFVRLSCNDGRLINGKLSGYTTTNLVGKVLDQYKKEYELTVISKKEFQKKFGKEKYTKQSYIEAIDELVKY